jgi:hypothetical protein
MVDEARVRIVGDASGVAPAVQATKDQFAGLQSTLAALTASFGVLSADIKASMASGAASTAEMAAEMRLVEAETRAEAISLREMAVSAHEGLEAVVSMKEAMFGFGELLLAAFAVEEIHHFAEQMGEAAEKIHHLSSEFGLSTAEVQRLQGVALGTGVSIDTLTRGMGILDKNTATASGSLGSVGKALKIVGISAGDGRTQMERLAQVADKFNSLSAGPDRLALSMELFGRNGKEMIPILELGSKGIEELADKSDRLGAVNEVATEKGLKLAEALNTNKIAWQGVQNVLTDAFAQTLVDIADGFQSLVVEMVGSYNSGGAVKEIFDGIKLTCDLLGKALVIVGDAIKLLYDNLNIIIPIVGAYAAVMSGRFVVSMASALLSITEVRVAMIALTLQFEAGGVVAAFTMLIEMLSAGMLALAAATAEATIALLASPWTWLALVVGGAIYLYEKFTEKTREQITADHDLADAKDKLAAAEGDLTKMSKEALEAMKAEDQVALNLAKAHLTAASAALEQAKAEATLAQKRFENQQKTIAPPDIVGGDIAGPNITYSSDANAANMKVKEQTASFKDQQKAVDTLQASIDKLDAAIAKAPSGGGGGHLDLTPSSKPKKEKDDLVQRLDDELTARKMAWAKEQDAQGTAQEYSIQSVADYWAAILERTDLGAKDRAKVEEKYLAARAELKKREIGIALDGYKDELAAANHNLVTKLDIAEREAAYIGKMYGMESKEYADVQHQIVALKREAAAQIAQIEEIHAQSIDRANLDAISSEEELAKHRVEMGVETNTQLLAQERNFENQRFAIDQAAMLRAKSLIDPSRDPVRYAQISAQIEALERQHQLRLTSIDRQAETQRSQLARQAIGQIASGWSQNIGKMLTLQQGFTTTVKGLWQTLQQAIGDIVAKIIENWLLKELTALAIKLGLVKMEGESTIATEAAKAGAGGTASMAAAPFPMNMGAPAFGAAMSAAAASYATMAAFDVGAYDLSSDGIGMLHKGETIIPADQAGGWRNVMGLFASMPKFGVPSVGFGAGANTNAPIAANDQTGGSGGFHYHDHTARGLTAAQIMANRDAFAKAMKQAHREGKLGFSLPG